MKAFFLFIVVLLAACSTDKMWQLQGKLEAMTTSEANTYFLNMPAQDQVDLYVWQLEHSRPPASPYEYLLMTHGQSVAPLLLEKAKKAEGFVIQAAILSTLAGIPKADRAHLDPIGIEAALGRCRSLSRLPNDAVCSDLERELKVD